MAIPCRMTPESVVLHAGYLVFNGAFIDLMPWLLLGGTYILHRAFDADAVIAEIEASRVTHIVMVPSQIVAVLNSPHFSPARLASLEMLLTVGAPLHVEHKQRLIEALPGRFYELYGLTEGFVTILDKTDAVRKMGSVGVPVAFYEMRILDEQGRDAPPGQVGEICGRGPLMMPGYYKRPDLTRQVIVDGWLHSGDLGYVDEEGYLYLVDRKKDMIISGGVNVYPRDIEEVVVQLPACARWPSSGAGREVGGNPYRRRRAPLPQRSHRPELGLGQRTSEREVPAGQRRGDRRRLPPQCRRQDAQARAPGAVRATVTAGRA